MQRYTRPMTPDFILQKKECESKVKCKWKRECDNWPIPLCFDSSVWPVSSILQQLLELLKLVFCSLIVISGLWCTLSLLFFRQCKGEGVHHVTWNRIPSNFTEGERLVYLLFIIHPCLFYLLFVSKVYNCFSFYRYHHISSALSFMWSTPTGSPPLFQKHCESSGEKKNKNKQHKQWTPVFIRFLRLKERRNRIEQDRPHLC